ncbi:hypothetical protein HYU21_00060, partial [Candidatus Woesearchaeota archaeon]|nr:hypothetical protein [Candidatus Woesearchaeota archaeon]
MPNPGLVQGPEPEFDGPGTAMADTLDAVVTGASTSANGLITPQPDYLQRMRHLGNMVVDAFILYRVPGNESYKKVNLTIPKDSEAALFLASFVSLNYKEDQVANVSFPEVKTATLKHFLESVYG